MLWHYEGMKHRGGRRQTQRCRQWITVVLLLLWLGSNKPVLQRAALFKFLITAQQRQLSFSNHWFVEAKQELHAKRKTHWFFFLLLFFSLFCSCFENLIVAFVPTVCWSGRTDHLHCGSVSGPPKEGIPTGDLYSCDVFHKLSPGTRHGYKSKICSGFSCSPCLDKGNKTTSYLLDQQQR